MGPYFVYILKCADGSFYVGHTLDVEGRVRVHNLGEGAKWTACRRPVSLVYREGQATEWQAVVRERQIKRWSAGKKASLAEGDLVGLKTFAKRRVF